MAPTCNSPQEIGSNFSHENSIVYFTLENIIYINLLFPQIRTKNNHRVQRRDLVT